MSAENMCIKLIDGVAYTANAIISTLCQTVKCLTVHFPKYWNQKCIYKRVTDLEKTIWKLENLKSE